MSKLDTARTIYREDPTLRRKDMLAKFMEATGMSQGVASVYYHNIRKELGEMKTKAAAKKGKTAEVAPVEPAATAETKVKVPTAAKKSRAPKKAAKVVESAPEEVVEPTAEDYSALGDNEVSQFLRQELGNGDGRTMIGGAE